MTAALERIARKAKALQQLGRLTDGIQVVILGTMGQYLYTQGEIQLGSPQWRAFRDFSGGQHAVGITVVLIALIGLAGIFSLAWTHTDRVYTVVMWLFTISAVVWCWTVAGFQTYALVAQDIGNAGLWNWGMAGMFFLFSRIAITIASGLDEERDGHA